MPKPKVNSANLEYEPKNLELIYKDLIKYGEDNPDKNKDIIVERIKQMTEFQIWGERNNESFFEFFCEKNVLEAMLNILKKSKAKDIIIQVIQSLSMYLTNIKKPVNINFILSNNSINEFITHNFDFNDDETVDYYISFLKSLSLRLETIPLELFYNKKYKDFPMLSRAVRFYNYPGSMVRTSVHNITLSLFQLKDAQLDTYLTNFPFAMYFVNLSCYLKELWIKSDQSIPESHAKNQTKLQDYLDDQYDLLMYIEDIFKLGNEKLNKILANALLSYAIIPTLLAPLASNDRGTLSLNLSLYLINLILSSITYTPLLEFIYVFLFSPNLNTELQTLKQSIPDVPASYCTNWSFKTPWDTREDVLAKKYLELLDHAQVGDNPQQPEPAKPQNAKNAVTINVEEEYKSFARYLGIIAEDKNTELIQLSVLAPLALMEEFTGLFNENGDLVVSDSELYLNQFRSNFFSFLLSRDDNMIMLVCSIIDSALNPASIQYSVPLKTFAICQTIFENCLALAGNQGGAQNPEGIWDKYETVRTILGNLYKLLSVDVPFRIATLSLIAKIITDLSESKNEEVMMSPDNLKIFNTGYKKSITKVLKFLQNSIVGELFADLFEMQWKDIYQHKYNKIKRKDQILLLLPIVEEAIPGLDQYMRLPVTECELAKREISVYLLYRKIRYSLIKSSKISQTLIEDYKPTYLKENVTNKWVEGTDYEIDQRKLHFCHLKEQSNKQACYLAEDEENLIIIVPDPVKLHWAKVLTNIKLKPVEAIVDRSNSSNLIISAKIKDKLIQKTLNFSDPHLCLAAKRAVDESRRYFKHSEMTALLKNFESTKNDIYELPALE